MRQGGPFDKKTPHRDGRPARFWPKPAAARVKLTPPELHAYYIALITSSRMWADPDGLHLKAS